MKYLWSGRFSKELHDMAKGFTFSIDIDSHLALFDVSGSIAHAMMLMRQKIIPRIDGEKIVSGLKRIENEIRSGKFIFKPEDEDIHTAVERRLIELIGPAGGKLHTARSRNDQIVLDEKLYLKQILPDMQAAITLLQKTLISRAQEFLGIFLPAFTHFQPAQPVLLSHYFLAYVCMLERDKERIRDSLTRINISPLGACACTGTSFPVDSEYIAKKLGFGDVFNNSIDAVSDRDFVLEAVCCLGILMVHLSRMAEELILWHSPLIGFVDLPEEFCTGSSIMPQKKNPDVLELIRGRTSTVIGNIAGMFSLMKGLPLSYNRDMQEDKRFLFETCEISYLSTVIIGRIIEKTKVDSSRMIEACNLGHIEATDIAEFLASKGIPFRQAHHIVAELVEAAIKKGVRIKDLDEKTIKQICGDDDIIDFIKNLDFEKSVNLKISPGGTSISEVKKELKKWKNILDHRNSTPIQRL
ncbi:MAG: argininosuccinate lyase [Candidatus Omnitrophica bacterium]|nr:argininosuccinate lyase [Candidatus Omnitrophota bacterium]MCM8788460.1 argininosuccinate lyase [Candidatus Omnitrophota bacterium]